MNKVIFIGKTGCGKTTLCQKLNDLKFEYRKTQVIELYENAIDTPGEYLENRHFYNALIVTAVDAEIIALIGDPTAEECFIPPAFTGTFSKIVIGIITKISLVTDEKQIRIVEERLQEAGVSKIFKVDTIENIGIEKLFNYLDDALSTEWYIFNVSYIREEVKSWGKSF